MILNVNALDWIVFVSRLLIAFMWIRFRVDCNVVAIGV
jgi:hypothetical protein